MKGRGVSFSIASQAPFLPSVWASAFYCCICFPCQLSFLSLRSRLCKRTQCPPTHFSLTGCGHFPKCRSCATIRDPPFPQAHQRREQVEHWSDGWTHLADGLGGLRNRHLDSCAQTARAHSAILNLPVTNYTLHSLLCNKWIGQQK